MGVIPASTVEKPLRHALGPSIVQQERDFQNAVQPGSPISALLQSVKNPLVSFTSADLSRSARQPLVRAPTVIKEPSLLRKLSAAGAQSTLSPVRKPVGKENAKAGPSNGRRRMEAVGEEGEEEEEEEDEPKGHGLEHRQPDNQANPAFEAVIRERQLATQKARIVSQMASTRTRALSPRRTVAVPSARRPEEAPVVKEVIPPRPKKSLFEVCWANIDHGLQMASTRAGYRSSRTCSDLDSPV